MTTNLLDELTLYGLRAFIKDERYTAIAEAKETCKVIRSRGTYLCTADERGNQCEPYPEAVCPEWKGTLAQIKNLIQDVENSYPDVAEVYIAGGYDGADSLKDMLEGEYEPWVSAWHLTIWKR